MVKGPQEIADELEAAWYANPRPSPLGVHTGCIRVDLAAPAALLTMNAAKTMHYRTWAKLTLAWREAMHDRAVFLGIAPATSRVGVEGYPHQKGGVLADPGAHMPCLKACVDGLRDAGVLVDDSPEHVAWVRLWAPVKDNAGAGFVVEIVPA